MSYYFPASQHFRAKVWLAICGLVIVSGSALAAPWGSWHSWPSDLSDSLSTHSVTALKLINGERLWIGTTDGVFLYEGSGLDRHTVSWRTGSQIPIERIITFAEVSHEGTYAFTHDDGIFYKESEGRTFYPVNFSGHLRKGDVELVLDTESHGVLLLQLGRITHLDLFVRVANEIPVIRPSREDVLALAYVGEDEFLAFTENRAISFKWNSRTGWRQTDFMSCTWRRPPFGLVVQVSPGDFFALTKEKSLSRFTTHEGRCEAKPIDPVLENAVGASRIRRITFLPKSELLSVATDRGVVLAGGEYVERIEMDTSLLRSNQIMAVTEAARNHLFVGTLIGVSEFSRPGFSVITAPAGTLNPEVTSIDSSEELGVFVLTYDNLLRARDTRVGTSFSKVPLPTYTGGLSSLAVTESGVYIGTTSGSVFFWTPRSGAETCMELEGSDVKSPITSITTEGHSYDIALSTLKGEVVFVQDCRVQMRWMPEAPNNSSPMIHTSYIGEQLWAFNFAGAHAVPPGVRWFNQSESQSVGTELGFVEGAWLGLEAAGEPLFAYPSGKMVSIADEPEKDRRVASVNEAIFAAQEDPAGRVWLATNSGLWVEARPGQPMLALASKDLRDISFDYSVSHTSADKRLFFGGTGGLVIVSEPNEIPTRPLGEIALATVRVGGEIASASNENVPASIELSSSSDALELQLKSRIQRRSSAPTYEVWLQGLHEHWQCLEGTDTVRYDNLPPGNYTFKARGADAFGVWSDNEIIVPITVLPPTWRAWWALLTYAIAACLLFLVARRSYRNHLLRSLRIQRAEEEARALARLEDEWQQQREANERLLQSITPSTQALLRAVEVALRAELDQHGGEARHFEKSLKVVEALERQQELISRSNAGDVCSLRALVEELVASIAAARGSENPVIIVNDTPDVTITARQAQYLALVVFEALYAVVARTRVVALEEPIIHVELLPPGYGDDPVETFVFLLEDRDFPVEETEGLEDSLSITTQLLQIFSGTVEIEPDVGLRLRIELAIDDAPVT